MIKNGARKLAFSLSTFSSRSADERLQPAKSDRPRGSFRSGGTWDGATPDGTILLRNDHRRDLDAPWVRAVAVPRPDRVAGAVAAGPAAPANSASPAGERLRDREAEASTARADGPLLSNQPRHRLATLRRPAADGGRRPGQRVGGRSAAHTGQGPLGSSAQYRLRLYPTRWRRPGFQQGNHDSAECQLLLRRCRPVADPGLDRCRLRAPGREAGPEFPASGHPVREERLAAHDSRRLLQRAPVP